MQHHMRSVPTGKAQKRRFLTKNPYRESAPEIFTKRDIVLAVAKENLNVSLYGGSESENLDYL